jgi:hypothetical protein
MFQPLALQGIKQVRLLFRVPETNFFDVRFADNALITIIQVSEIQELDVCKEILRGWMDC